MEGELVPVLPSVGLGGAEGVFMVDDDEGPLSFPWTLP